MEDTKHMKSVPAPPTLLTTGSISNEHQALARREGGKRGGGRRESKGFEKRGNWRAILNDENRKRKTESKSKRTKQRERSENRANTNRTD
eukprot:158827-Rhodomonas_salina.2